MGLESDTRRCKPMMNLVPEQLSIHACRWLKCRFPSIEKLTQGADNLYPHWLMDIDGDSS
ncbi:hypothetical protein NC652_005499 [Populus alba x Populus x berolinensis]|nr:hypothetical protein NC652_005499 [Populus alba x Populus x berolinensis]